MRPDMLSQKCGFYFFPDFNLENKKLSNKVRLFALDSYSDDFTA